MLTLTCLLALSSGCVSYTTVKDEPRKQAHFASQKAAETFYEAYLLDNYPPGCCGGKTNMISVDLASPYWHRKQRTDNVRFNSTILKADTDHDGTISEDESAAYSADVSKRRVCTAAK